MGRAARDPTTGVTAKEDRFAFEYVMTGRRVLAYRQAYEAGGSAAETCRVNANKLLDSTPIALRVEHYRKIAEGKLEASIERIALELSRIAFFDLGRLQDDDGNPVPLHELDEDTRRALNGLDIEEIAAGAGENRVVVGHVKKYKHVPKVEALRVLAQWRGMLVERKEIGKPGEFDGMSVEELRKTAQARAVRLGLGKVVSIDKAKRSVA